MFLELYKRLVFSVVKSEIEKKNVCLVPSGQVGSTIKI